MNWPLCCSWTTQTQFSCTRLLKIILPSDCKSRSVFCNISRTDLSLHVVELTAPLFQFSQSSHNIVSTHCNKLVSEIGQCGGRGWAAGCSAPFRGGNVRHPPYRQWKGAGATDSVGITLNRGTEALEQMLSKHPESWHLLSPKFQLISDFIHLHTVDLINSLF